MLHRLIMTLMALVVHLAVIPSAFAQSVFQSNFTDVPIPDATTGGPGNWVSSTITISGLPANAVVTGIDVYFRCVHTYSGDLLVDINADSTGSLGNYPLWNREGGRADNPTRTVNNISTYNGLSPNRTWYLYARDMAPQDTGYIDEWSITVRYTFPHLSDLITQNLSVSPNHGPAGSSATVSFNIRNQGNGPSNACTTNIRLSASNVAPSTSDPLLASINTNALAVGGTQPVSHLITIPPGTPSGLRYVWVIVDVNSTAGQGPANEANDRSNTPFQVTTPPLPDLITQNLTVNPTSGPAGSQTTVSFTIRNQGGATSNACTTNIRLSASSTAPSTSDPLLASISTNVLAVGGTQFVSQTITIPSGTPAGTRHVWVILDVNSTAGQGQANEANDRSNTTFNVTTMLLPDLIPQNLTVSPNQGPAGSLTTVSFTIRNQGSGTSNPCTTNARLSASSSAPSTGDPLLFSINTPALGVNATQQVSQQVTIPPGTTSGLWYVWVIADANSAAGQGSSNEGNDRISTTFNVDDGPLPPGGLQWPVINPLLSSNGYARYNEVGNNEYHTGMDLTSMSGSLAVLAAGSGVARTLPMGTYGQTNHNLGHVVIIHHPQLRLYTLYGHLASIAVADGPVTAGQQIGTMGSTGCNSCGVHLHFELKHFGVLGNLHDDVGPEWGYTPTHPNLWGYVNPRPYIDYAPSTFDPKGIVATSDQVVRTGPVPALYTTEVTSVTAGQHFAAFAQYGNWYQVYLPSSNGPATGWIQGALSPANALLEVVDPVESHIGVNVRASPSSVSSAISKVWDRQWLVRASSPTAGTGCSVQWHQVDCAQITGVSLGWVCGNYLALRGVTDNCGGDANGDGIVNGADLSVLLFRFGHSVTPGTAADFNGDGLVDGADLSVLLFRFGLTCN